MTKTRHEYNLGIIGNCSYIAYIDTTANVRWLCLPGFDSSFVFGSLLDPVKGGEFYVRPAGVKYSTSQYYIKNTNILVTEFAANGNSFRVTDFAPRFYQFDRYYKPQMLIRKIESVAGNSFIRVKCAPVGDFGKSQSSFLLCSFWYAEALACAGRTEEACKMIQRLLSCTNHLGLLSEDADNSMGQWGNFPQTYSHVGLINAVFRIGIKLDKPFFY